MLPQTKVFVGSLPQGSKPEDLRKLFERFGVVTECDIMNRCGFVHMQSEEQASAAIRGLNNTSFNGGVISVERGRIKERGMRGGRGGGMRGGMRGGGGERRGGGRAGPHRDAPYARPPPHAMAGGGGGGYERPAERGYDERYNGYGGYGYGGEDRRGFALMEGRAREAYAAPAPLYEERRGYGEELAPLYGDERRALYPDERELLERRAPPLRPPPMPNAYDRAPPRHPMGNGDMFSRRSPMRGPGGPGGYDRDPYAQQYPPMGRGGGGAARGGRELGGGPGPRRY